MNKIWFVNHFAVTPDLPGGSRHFDFSVELAKHGYDISIFASDFSYLHRKYYKLKDKQKFLVENVEGVDFVWVRASAYGENNLQRVLNMLSFSWNFMFLGLTYPKAKVIVGSSPHLFAAFAAYLVSRLRRIKFVLEIRDLWPQVLIDMGKSKEGSLLVKVLKIIENVLYKGADRIIILALGTQEYLVKKGIPGSKIVFIPNGVNLVHLKPSLDREEARKKHRFNKFTLVYAGAHGPANALDTILKAAKQLKPYPDIEFVLLGDGPDKEKLKKMALEFKLNNIRFMDPIPKKEMPDFLLASDVGVITLAKVDLFSYGVSPNKLFHYMGSSLPVICAVAGDMGQLVSRLEAGITVAPEDEKALSEAALKMYHLKSEERRKMGEKGYSYVCKHCNSEMQFFVLDKIFKELIGESK